MRRAIASAAGRVGVLLLAAALAEGCDSVDRTSTPAPTSSAVVAGLFVITSNTLGPIVIDAQGYVLYRFDGDSSSPSRSSCSGNCAARWLPTSCVDEIQVEGIDRQLVGCVDNPDGSRQLTLAGWPTYGYAGDRSPGDTNGQGVDGQWFALSPSGGRAGAAPG